MLKKIISILLSLLFVISCLASCVTQTPPELPDDPIDINVPEDTTEAPSEETTAEVTDEATESTETERPGLTVKPPETEAPPPSLDSLPHYETVYPEIKASNLKVTLSSKDTSDFNSALTRLQSVYKSNKVSQAANLKKMLYDANSKLVALKVQYDIAHLIYMSDPMSDKAWNDCNKTFDAYSAAYTKFWDFMDEMRKSKNKLYYVVEEFNKTEYPYGNNSSGGVDTSKLEALESEFDDLVSRGASKAELVALYNKYQKEGNALAKKLGYKNYYDYKSKREYHRDYEKTQREQLRQYVKDYIVPLFNAYVKKMNTITLTQAQYNAYSKYMNAPYDTLDDDYLFDYFASLPEEHRAVMESAFNEDRILFAENENVASHAYVADVGNVNICFLGKDRRNIDSVASEIGLYYFMTAGNIPSTNVSYDMSETFAGTNAMLMASHMNKVHNGTAYNLYISQCIYSRLFSIIAYTIYDEFEEIAYSSAYSGSFTQEQLDNFMSGLLEKYKVKGSDENIDDWIESYWPEHVVSEHVGYSLSFATASVVALQFYCNAHEDYDAAVNTYCKMVNNIDSTRTFVLTLSKAGIYSPFEEEAYKTLQTLLSNFSY